MTRTEKSLFVAAATLFVLALVSGCADKLQAARTTLATIGRLNSEFVDFWKKFDNNKQTEIRLKANSLEEGEKNLAAYRVDQDVAVKAFSGVYIVMVALEKAIAFTEMGLAGIDTLAPIVAQLWDAFTKLKTVLANLGVNMGGL